MTDIPELEITKTDEVWLAGYRSGKRLGTEWALEDLRARIQSELDQTERETGDCRPGLREALKIVERMEKDLK